MSTIEPVQAGRTPHNPKYRALVLFMLFVVYAFNFLDRQILGILMVEIAPELGLNDRERGLLGGFAFALLYSTLGVPIAWLADRTNRTWIVTVSLSVWSGFTVLCGFTQSFWQLFFARAGVGIGEAGGVAPSYSLIADYFPSNSRARALALYSLGIPIGSAIGIVVGAQIASGNLYEGFDWRWAFIIVGLGGLIVAPVFKFLVNEPKRGGLDQKTQTISQSSEVSSHSQSGSPDIEAKEEKRAGFLEVLGLLSKKPSFWFLTLGATCSSMMGYGVFFWVPELFARTFGLPLVDIGWMFGTIVFIGGSLGLLLGGVMGDLMGRGRKFYYALIPAIAFFITFPFYIAGTMASTPMMAVLIFLVPTGLGLAWLGPTLSTFQHLVPPHMRSMASAIFLLINNLLGIGGGIYVLGEFSTLLTPYFGAEALRYSIMAGASLYVVAGVLFLFAAKTIARDWEQ